MKTAFVEFEFAEPVAESCTSAGGKCVSCSLSARLHDRAEMSRLDSVVASIPGFKMCH